MPERPVGRKDLGNGRPMAVKWFLAKQLQPDGSFFFRRNRQGRSV